MAIVHSDQIDSAPEDLGRVDWPYSVGGRTALIGAGLLFVATAAPALATGGRADMVHLAITTGLGTALVALSSFDLATFRLPDALTQPLLLAGLLVSLLSPPHLLDSVAGAAVGYGVLWSVATGYYWIRGHAGLGLGDAKLMAAAGSWLGVEALPTVLLVASVLGLCGAVVLRVCGAEISARTRMAFGPFLALSFWMVWLYGAWLG